MLTKQQAHHIAGISIMLAVAFFIQGCANSSVGAVAVVTASPVYDENLQSAGAGAFQGTFACRSDSSSQRDPLQKSEPVPEQSGDSGVGDCALPSEPGTNDSVSTERSSEARVGQAVADQQSDADGSVTQDKNGASGESSVVPPPDSTDSEPSCTADDDCADKGLGVATGTGFFISERGFLVTNAHVIAGSVELYVLHNGETLPAAVIIADEENDLALLRVEIESPRLALQNIEPLMGEEIAVIGFPNVVVMGNAVKATFGHVNANSGPRGDNRYLQFDAPIQPGSSGSPVVDASGAVVGVATASLNQAAALRTSGSLAQSVNYAVKADFLLPLISIVPDWILAPEAPVKELSTTEVAAKVEPSVVLIINVHDGSSEVQARRKGDSRQHESAGGADALKGLPEDAMAGEGSDSALPEESEPEGFSSQQEDPAPSKSDSLGDSASPQVGQSEQESMSRPSSTGASGTGTWYLYKERSDDD